MTSPIDEPDIRDVARRVDAMGLRLNAMSVELKKNSETTRKVEANTAEIVEVFDAMKGGFKVLGWIGKAGEKVLWLGMPGAAILYGWDHIKHWLGLK